jgi:hypothetical protein
MVLNGNCPIKLFSKRKDAEILAEYHQTNARHYILQQHGAVNSIWLEAAVAKANFHVVIHRSINSNFE